MPLASLGINNLGQNGQVTKWKSATAVRKGRRKELISLVKKLVGLSWLGLK